VLKILLAFLVAFAIFYFGIAGFRNLTGKDQWALVKLLSYSFACAILAIGFLVALVIIF
jgi:hypothetical protein